MSSHSDWLTVLCPHHSDRDVEPLTWLTFLKISLLVAREDVNRPIGLYYCNNTTSSRTFLAISSESAAVK